MNPLITTALRRLATRWQSSPGPRWLQAWLRELHGLLPAPVRARLATAPRLQRLDWPLPTRPERSRAAVLVLPASEVMAQTISLPTAALADLQQVLGFEIERYTPLAREQVHFTARVLQRDSERATVLLVAISRERLAAMLAQCHASGVRVHSVDALGSEGQPLAVDLLPVAQRLPASRGAWVNRLGGLVAVLLLAALMLTLLDQRQARVERMTAAVDQQRQHVAELAKTRRELTDTQGAASYLTRLKTARPTLTVLLTELSRCLGDDSWLQQLEVRDNGEVSLSGESRHASALISRVRDCHSLQEPRFQGVIQPDAHSGNEHFSLVAQLRPEAADAPPPQPH